MENIYNIKRVAKETGLTPITIRAWETRYNVVQPARTEGGHRLYTDEDVKILTWLQEQTQQKGLRIRQAVQLLRHHQRSLASHAAPPSSLASLQEAVYESLMEAHVEQAERLTNDGFSMYAFDHMLHQVLAPLLIRVGDEWEQGNISIAQEHMASEFVRQRLLKEYYSFPINPALPKVIAACPSGERHELGLLLFSLFLRQKGMDVLYLGADTPAEGLDKLIHRHQADWLCLSLSDADRLEHLAPCMETITSACPQVKILLGGRGVRVLAEDHPWRGRMIGSTLEQWQQWHQEQLGAFPRPPRFKPNQTPFHNDSTKHVVPENASKAYHLRGITDRSTPSYKIP